MKNIFKTVTKVITGAIIGAIITVGVMHHENKVKPVHQIITPVQKVLLQELKASPQIENIVCNNITGEQITTSNVGLTLVENFNTKQFEVINNIDGHKWIDKFKTGKEASSNFANGFTSSAIDKAPQQEVLHQ